MIKEWRCKPELVVPIAMIVDAQPLALQQVENEEAIHGILPPL